MLTSLPLSSLRNICFIANTAAVRYERMPEELGYQQVLFPTRDDSGEYGLFSR